MQKLSLFLISIWKTGAAGLTAGIFRYMPKDYTEHRSGDPLKIPA
jgi:hypothetical protein